MEFKDRNVQNEHTFNCILNEDGSMTFEDNPGEIYEEGTSVDSELFKQFQEELIQKIENKNQKHMIAAYLSSGKTLTTAGQYARIPLDEYNSVGSKLTFDSSGNSIIVGSGVNKIRIEGILSYLGTDTNSNFGLVVYKNGTSIGVSINSGNSTTSLHNQIQTKLPIIDVTEGDKIQMYVRTVATDSKDVTINGSSHGTATMLEVEVLE